jgi:hypothetical protein
MKLCPLCKRYYEDRFISCAHDRSTLIADLPGLIRPKAVDLLRRARLLLMICAIAIVLGLAGGLWVGSRSSSASLPATSRAIPVAEAAGQTEPVTLAKSSSAIGVEEPLADASDVNSTPGSVKNPPRAATPVIVDEEKARRAAPADESRGRKELGPNPAAASAGPSGRKAAIESYVSAGGEPEKRQGGDPCRLLVSERSLSIRAGGGSDTITVSSQNVDGPAQVTATTKDWPDIVIFPESRSNPGGPIKYSVISVSKRAGTYAVNFKSPCGIKTVPVTVQPH